MSSYSRDLKIELMVTGQNAGTWGAKTNTNLNLVQQAIAGSQQPGDSTRSSAPEFQSGRLQHEIVPSRGPFLQTFRPQTRCLIAILQTPLKTFSE